jgi:hypothetical protein
MSELIQEFRGKKLEEWETLYLNSHPEAIEKAKTKIMQMIGNFKLVITRIDEEMIRTWVKDLVIVKTFVGLKFQEAILKKVASHAEKSYRISNSDEDAKGKDGYIGDKPVSTKPHSYESKQMLPESIGVQMIYYDKVKEGIHVFFDGF